MAIYTNSYKVTVNTVCGSDPFEFDDAVDAGSGASAYASLQAKEAIEAYITDDGSTALVIIPYEAVCNAVIEVTRTETEAPEDETCPSD